MATPPVSPDLARAAELMKSGQRDAAGRLLKAYLADHPRDADAWWLMSHAVSRPENVRKCLERVVQLRPGDARAKERLARLTSPEEPDDSFFTLPPADPPAPKGNAPVTPPAPKGNAPAPFDPTADLGAPFDPFVGIEPADDPFAALRGQPPGTGNQPEWSPGLGFVTERAPKAPASRARFEFSRGTIALIAGVCAVVVLVAAILALGKQRGWIGGLPEMQALDGGSFTLEYPVEWGGVCKTSTSGTPVCGVANDPRFNTVDLYTGQAPDFGQQLSILASDLLTFKDYPDLSVSVIAQDFPTGVTAPVSQAQTLHQFVSEYNQLGADDIEIDYDERQQTIDGRTAYVYRLDVHDKSNSLQAFVTGGDGDWTVIDVYIPHSGGTFWMTVEAMGYHNRVKIPYDVIEHIIASVDFKAG